MVVRITQEFDKTWTELNSGEKKSGVNKFIGWLTARFGTPREREREREKACEEKSVWECACLCCRVVSIPAKREREREFQIMISYFIVARRWAGFYFFEKGFEQKFKKTKEAERTNGSKLKTHGAFRFRQQLKSRMSLLLLAAAAVICHSTVGTCFKEPFKDGETQ